MKPHVKEILIGMLIGLAANMAGSYLYNILFFKTKLGVNITGRAGK